MLIADVWFRSGIHGVSVGVVLRTEVLRTIFTQGCRVLHLTCHGSDKVFFLETEKGTSQRVTRDALRALLTAGLEPADALSNALV